MSDFTTMELAGWNVQLLERPMIPGIFAQRVRGMSREQLLRQMDGLERMAEMNGRTDNLAAWLNYLRDQIPVKERSV